LDPDHVADRLQLVGLVIEVAEDTVGDGVGAGIADQNGMSVAFLAHDFRCSDGAARARPVSHDRVLAPDHLQMLRQQAPHHVGAAARGGRHDDADGLGRPPIGRKAALWQSGCSRECGSSRQHIAARKQLAHVSPPASNIVLQASVGNAAVAGKLTAWRDGLAQLRWLEAEQLEQRRQVAELLA
jgi:hypothetical protein